ncbi:MAG: hypothetical protein LIP08_09230 [Bacteroides sp.]|nr:hypothetical protein [Bacteroides sp.]
MATLVFSCTPENETVFQEVEELSIQTRSTTVPNIWEQLEGMPVNLKTKIPGDPKYIYLGIKGDKISLHEDESVNTRWYIKNKTSFRTVTHLQPISNPTKYLGASRETVTANPENGATALKFPEVENTSYVYITSSGNSLPYLQAVATNKSDVKWGELAGNQDKSVWEIVPLEKFDLVSMDYYMDQTDIVKSLPVFYEEMIMNNNSPTPQTMTASFSRKATLTSNFSEEKGVSLSHTTTIKTVGIPTFEASHSITGTTTQKFTYGTSDIQEDSRAYSFPLVVPGYSSYKASVSVLMYEASVSYKATYKGELGNTLILTGKWEGVSAGVITYNILDLNGNIIQTIVAP